MLPRALLAVLVLLAATACSTSGDEPAVGPPPGSPTTSPSAPRTIVVTPIPVPPGVRLSFIQQRISEGTSQAQVRVVNGTDRPLRVRSIGIDWAGFPLRLQRFPYVVASKATVDLPYRLPRAVCTAAARRAPITGVAVTQRGRSIRRPVEADGVRFLQRIREAQCSERRIAAAVDLRYADDFHGVRRDGRLHLRGSLLLDRRASTAPVRVAQVEGSVLYELRLAGRRTLPAGEPRARIPLDVTDGGRCDPHSRGQSTQTFLFRVWLRLGDGPLVGRILEPTRPQQARLLAFLDRACALAATARR